MAESYDTLVEAIQKLRKQGYIQDYNLQSTVLECKVLNHKMAAADFTVDKYFRFEGASSTDDSSILYAITSVTFNTKGILIDAYGVYGGSISPEILQKLRFKNR